MQRNRLGAAIDFRLVTILNPENAEAHNGLAWSMSSVPGQTPFEITLALDSARKAVELAPRNWMYWNTLGVVAFRAGDWKLAAASLEKSIDLNKPGGAIDFFFLAMTRWHQAQPDEARRLFAQAATYLRHNPGDQELSAFFKEARALLYPPPKAESQIQQETGNEAEDTEEA
jgi:Flp pilus assembly protein TadD